MPGLPPSVGRAAGAALAAAALWGGMYVVSKDTFSEIPPISLGALRLLLAGSALAIVLRARGKLARPRGGAMPLAAIALAATMVTQFVGTELATASGGALLTTTTPLFLVPLGWLALRERPTRATVAGIGAGMAGVVLAVGGGIGARNPWGPALLLLSAAGWAGYTVVAAPVSRREGPLVAVTWSTLLALPMVSALALTEADRWRAAPFTDPATLLAVAYLGLAASAGAWYLWNRGVAGLPAAAAGACFFVQPLVGGVLAWALLGERLTPAFALGGALILVGVVLAIGTPGRPVAERRTLSAAPAARPEASIGRERS
ncbi:MAG TPA: EamA family transporter [Actinomycetota bacterium]|nr:EamA family transporter [Actinomycetota bacterium]